jgi:hypothetical protein
MDRQQGRRSSASNQLFCIIERRIAMAEIEMLSVVALLLSVVALLEDIPQRRLLRGQVGTVVESLAQGLYEVEFSDDAGQTYASLALRSGQLMRPHHEPGHRAA